MIKFMAIQKSKNKLPFEKKRYPLAGCELEPMEPVDALLIAQALSKMNPWRTLNYEAENLSRGLLSPDPFSFRYTITGSGQRVGVVCVKHPWLRGTYLELLGIFEPFQQMGIGSQIIQWMESRTRSNGNNLWALVSGFNKSGREFYRKMGFEEMATLKDLVQTGSDEILIRKILK